jgi:hypothetical protein
LKGTDPGCNQSSPNIHSIINMDETSWKSVNHGFTNVADWGSETVNCLFGGDPKTCLTAIDAAEGKLPAWILCHGKTVRYEQQYQSDVCLNEATRRRELVAEVACDYFRWLRARFSNRPIVLLWDVFTVHRCRDAMSLARELNIAIEFVPPRMTGECQPLDRRILGNLKSRTGTI